MNELDSLEKELSQLLEDFKRDIATLEKGDPSQRMKQTNRCQNKILEIRTKIESLELEMLQVDRQTQNSHRGTLKNLQNEFKELRNEFDKKRVDRIDIEGRSGTEDEWTNIDNMTGQELIKAGDRMQKTGKDALQNIMRNIESANEKADHINVEIARQDEVITKTKEKTLDVQSELKKAGAYLRYFARQIYTDKILMGLVLLCTIAMIVIIILKIVRKEDFTTVDDVVNAVKNR